MQKIKFRGEEFLLIAGRAITSEAVYKSGECSYAYLGGDGIVRRFCKEIGTEADIEYLGDPIPDDIEKSADWFANLLGPSWEGA